MKTTTTITKSPDRTLVACRDANGGMILVEKVRVPGDAEKWITTLVFVKEEEIRKLVNLCK